MKLTELYEESNQWFARVEYPEGISPEDYREANSAVRMYLEARTGMGNYTKAFQRMQRVLGEHGIKMRFGSCLFYSYLV